VPTLVRAADALMLPRYTNASRNRYEQPGQNTRKFGLCETIPNIKTGGGHSIYNSRLWTSVISFDLSVSKHPAKPQKGHRSDISLSPYYTNRYTNPLGQHSFHRGGRLVAHARHYVAVAVQSHGYSGMPKKLLYQLGVVSSIERGFAPA
jgi:hypothetical protein